MDYAALSFAYPTLAPKEGVRKFRSRKRLAPRPFRQHGGMVIFWAGDAAGALLYSALVKTDFAQGCYAASPDDGLELVECWITNAVRCVPPNNRPLARELGNCGEFLGSEISAMRRLRVILALGAVAHRAVHIALHMKQAERPFAHGAAYPIGGGRVLVDSYHFSRQKVASGRLNAAMFEKLVVAIKRRLQDVNESS